MNIVSWPRADLPPEPHIPYGFGGDAIVHSSLRPGVRRKQQLKQQWDNLRVGVGPRQAEKEVLQGDLPPQRRVQQPPVHAPHAPLLGDGGREWQEQGKTGITLRTVEDSANIVPVRVEFESFEGLPEPGLSAQVPGKLHKFTSVVTNPVVPDSPSVLSDASPRGTVTTGQHATQQLGKGVGATAADGAGPGAKPATGDGAAVADRIKQMADEDSLFDMLPSLPSLPSVPSMPSLGVGGNAPSVASPRHRQGNMDLALDFAPSTKSARGTTVRVRGGGLAATSGGQRPPAAADASHHYGGSVADVYSQQSLGAASSHTDVGRGVKGRIKGRAHLGLADGVSSSSLGGGMSSVSIASMKVAAGGVHRAKVGQLVREFFSHVDQRRNQVRKWRDEMLATGGGTQAQQALVSFYVQLLDRLRTGAQREGYLLTVLGAASERLQKLANSAASLDPGLAAAARKDVQVAAAFATGVMDTDPDLRDLTSTVFAQRLPARITALENQIADRTTNDPNVAVEVEVQVLSEHLRLLNLAANSVQQGSIGVLLVVLRELTALADANACDLSRDAHLDIQLLAAYADELVARWDGLLNAALALPRVEDAVGLIVLPSSQVVGSQKKTPQQSRPQSQPQSQPEPEPEQETDTEKEVEPAEAAQSSTKQAASAAPPASDERPVTSGTSGTAKTDEDLIDDVVHAAASEAETAQQPQQPPTRQETVSASPALYTSPATLGVHPVDERRGTDFAATHSKGRAVAVGASLRRLLKRSHPCREAVSAQLQGWWHLHAAGKQQQQKQQQAKRAAVGGETQKISMSQLESAFRSIPGLLACLEDVMRGLLRDWVMTMPGASLSREGSVTDLGQWEHHLTTPSEDGGEEEACARLDNAIKLHMSGAGISAWLAQEQSTQQQFQHYQQQILAEGSVDSFSARGGRRRGQAAAHAAPATSIPRQAALVGFGSSPRSALQWRPRPVAPPLHVGMGPPMTSKPGLRQLRSSPRGRRLHIKKPRATQQQQQQQRGGRLATDVDQQADDEVPQWWQALRAAVECIADPTPPPADATRRQTTKGKPLAYSKVRGWARELYASTVKVSLDQLDNPANTAAWDEEAFSAALNWLRECGGVLLLPEHIAVLPAFEWTAWTPSPANHATPPPPVAAAPTDVMMPLAPRHHPEEELHVAEGWGERRLGSARDVSRRVSQRAVEQLAKERALARRTADTELAAASRYFSPRWGPAV